MPEHKARGEAGRNYLVCVDAYDRGEMKGRLYHPALESGSTAFYSAVDLLLRADGLMDAQRFPQSCELKRSFAPLPGLRPDDPGGEPESRGRLATFSVRLLFRQHASWQGTVTWVEQHGEQSFRSVLELLVLMNSALGGRGNGMEYDG